MIKRIELKNFESHKHTVIDCISDGLNLIRGPSNVGKTSIVRALKLVAYNEFDPKSVRTGTSHCEVTVETERGVVSVKRGPKVNSWDVTPIGEKTIPFDKVGRAVIPEAARIIGMNIVKLGDAEIPVNIMDQLESHFMLKSMGGKDVSGSMRAQVVDEISGLSGIEGVIKAVSLDVHRIGREIKTTEDKMNETQEQLHDENELKAESDRVETAKTELFMREECVRLSGCATASLEGYNASSLKKKEITRVLASLPDTRRAKVVLEEASQCMERERSGTQLLDSVGKVSVSIDKLRSSLKSMPDTKKASLLLDQAMESLDAAKSMSKCLTAFMKDRARRDAILETLQSTEVNGDPVSLLDNVKVSSNKVMAASKALNDRRLLDDKLASLREKLEDNVKRMEQAKMEVGKLLKEITVCPLSLKPVSPECIEGVET